MDFKRWREDGIVCSNGESMVVYSGTPPAERSEKLRKSTRKM
jgi:hypothetical protein